MTAAESAVRYIQCGFHPIPIPFRSKRAILDGWPDLRITLETACRYFPNVPINQGIILGDEYGTTDIDLDCPEAITAAGNLLPETRMIFGRASKPRSHYFYRSDPPIRSKRYLDPTDKSCLVELRCRKSDGTTGLQTVVPPSTHECGEIIRFEQGLGPHPANIDADALIAAVARVAAASLLARHWPTKGRHFCELALAGVLVRGGWILDEARTFCLATYRSVPTHDTGAYDRIRQSVESTFQKHAAGDKTTGKTDLVANYIDRRVISKTLEWLRVEQAISEAVPALMRSEPARRVSLPQPRRAEDLIMDESIVPPAMAIEGLIPERGLVLLGGRPKTGKSWLSVQLGLAFSTGIALGGWLKVIKPGRCHLFALEDGLAITKDKILKLLGEERPDGFRDLSVFDELASPILRGGDEIIHQVLTAHPAEMIILDSLFKLTGHPKAHEAITQADYDVIDRIRKIALEHNAVAVIPMHTRKGATGGAPIENLMGTTGNTAACDVACELSRTGMNGKLTVVGRIMEEKTFEMTFNQGAFWGWTIEGSAGDAAAGDTAEDVAAYLEAQGAAKPGPISVAIRKSFGATWQALLRLQAKGLVVRDIQKKWSIVGK